ncbi:hypothetical protein KCP70_07520 [Salmonella enterica subsp. enterica]|nr:hypothetical protein KCP70_07520 [Salmonella enterica subsp. enterica]
MTTSSVCGVARRRKSGRSFRKRNARKIELEPRLKEASTVCDRSQGLTGTVADGRTYRTRRASPFHHIWLGAISARSSRCC